MTRPLTISDAGHRVVPKAAGRAAHRGKAGLPLERLRGTAISILLLLLLLCKQLQTTLNCLHWTYNGNNQGMSTFIVYLKSLHWTYNGNNQGMSTFIVYLKQV